MNNSTKCYPLIFLFTVLVNIHYSCRDALDINNDPLSANSVSADLLFPGILVALSNNRTAVTTARIGNIVQYYEPLDPEIGEFALGVHDIYLTGNTWGFYYGRGLINLVLAENTAKESDPPCNNIVAQSKIMQGFIYYLLTGYFEDIPFTEAANLAYLEPHFDTQQTVLHGIIKLLDEAVNLLLNRDDGLRVVSGDLIYGGDLDNWERFANSLKLKCLMLLINKEPDAVGQIEEILTKPLINELIYEAELRYTNTPGNANPFGILPDLYFGGFNPQFWMGSTTFQTIMTELHDPRLSTYYDESDEPEVIGSGDFAPGATPGSYGGLPDHSVVSLNIIRPDYADRYMTASEVMLLKAEAIASGYGQGGMVVADAIYRTGIQLSMDYFDGKPGAIESTLKEAYLNSLPALTTLENDSAIRAIQLQLYIANFLRMPEAWIQWRRTKMPELILPLGSRLSDIIRRLPYPPDETGTNPNLPQQKTMDTPMWYEK